MRICFCIKAMNNPGGGAENVLAVVASGLAERGHDVHLVTFDQPGQSFFALSSLIRRTQLGIGSTTDPATILETIRRIGALRSCLRGLSPDIAVGFMHSMYIPLGLALVGTGIPLVASEHIVPSHYETRPWEAALLRLTPYLARRITCVSEQVRDLYPRALRKRMLAIANPVAQARGCADVARGRGGRNVLLSAGRFDPQKDHKTLIDAFAAIASAAPDWDLRIVGDGALRGQLEAQIRRHELEERVQLPGVSRDVAAEYMAAQLFVVPSRYESFGLTTAEAMAHGLPAVGFDDCPGTNWLIRPGVNGELTRGAGDRSATLAETLLGLMRDGARRVQYAEKALDLSRQYEPAAVLDSWERLIRDVTGRAPVSAVGAAGEPDAASGNG